MNTWKIKKKQIKKPKSPIGRRVTAVVMLFLTIAFGVYAFPSYWNNAANAMRLPNGLRVSDEPFRLGLDLKGGTHLVYDADMSQIPDDERTDALEGVKNVIERRVNAFGVSEPIVQTTTTGGTYRLIIELAGISDVSDAIEQIGQTPVLEFKSPGQQLDRDLTDEEKIQLDEAVTNDRRAAQVMLGRALSGEDFDALVSENARETIEEATIQGITENSVYGDVFKTIGSQFLRQGQVSRSTYESSQGIWVFRLEKQEQTQDEPSIISYTVKRILMPLTNEFDIVPQVSPWVNTSLSGKQLKSATVQFDQQTGVPNVLLNFNAEGAELFGELTKTFVGQQVAIFLDGQVVSAPVVQQAIYGGQAVITGDFTLDESKLLARELNAGALPVAINLLSQQTVGPTLGLISLQKSVIAALIGFALVGIFMIGIYRLGGLIAVFALAFFAFLNLAAYKFFGVTITLAGIAGFVLSLGIAVDANVLILERLKEEYASGRDLSSSIDEAFSRAWTAIRDGNLTTLIAAAVLYWFSSSFIRGFALTLSVGVILSMFTAISVSRVYLKNVVDAKWARKPALFCVKK